MKLRNYLFLWAMLFIYFIFLTSGCTSTDFVGSNEEQPVEEEIDGPGGLTPFGPEQDPLFGFYDIPADWPRVVPIMNDFQVTHYQWSEEEMYAAGYGNVSISRASNFYTNAQKIHVSSNIWEQDPINPSVAVGSKQIFHYIGEGNSLSVVLLESGENSLYFELFFKAASQE